MSENKLKILVVEDERLLLSAIGTKLRNEGIESILCEGGEEAIEYLKTAKELPSVIWLDYYLKDMDGLVFMRHLKKNKTWQNIPVVVVSNSASVDKVQNMHALGVKQYLLKADYRLDDIIKTIKASLG